MSDDENFVSRWSRLKRKSAGQSAKPAEPAEDAWSEAPHAEAPPAPGTRRAAPEEPQIDLSSLPSLDEITAGTDIRAFLQRGVPADLAKAALRRAWTADPAIRDFVGIAENQWDFTDPASIPGFGPLLPEDNVPDLVARAMGRLDETVEQARQGEVAVAKQEHAALGVDTAAADQADPVAAPEAIGEAARTDEADDRSASSVSEQRKVASLSPHVENEDEDAHATIRRSHGRALPQ